MPNIMQVEIDTSNRISKTTNMTVYQNSTDNLLKVYYKNEYSFIELVFRRPDGFVSYPLAMTMKYDRDLHENYAEFDFESYKYLTSYIISGSSSVQTITLFLHTYDNSGKDHIVAKPMTNMVVKYTDNDQAYAEYNPSDINNLWNAIGDNANTTSKLINGDIPAYKAINDIHGNQIDLTYETIQNVDTKDKGILKQSKEYTDEQCTETLNTSKDYTDYIVENVTNYEKVKQEFEDYTDNEIDKIKDGTYIAGKTIEDKLGNEINKKYASDFSFTYDQSSGKVYIEFLNADKETISQKYIDLPLEELVTSGYYDEDTKSIVLVLADEEKITIPVGDLLDGVAYTSYVDEQDAKKADKSDTYTKKEVDTKLDTKANKSDVYTKTDVDDKLKLKSDKSNTYTKDEVDTELNKKANSSDVYTQSEINTKLDTKADKSNTYTKDEIDTKLDTKLEASDLEPYAKTVDVNKSLDLKADKSNTYTMSSVDTLLSQKANKATTLAGYSITDAYTKNEVDNKLTSVFVYKGSVDTYDDLPTTNNKVGDTYNVLDTGFNYSWSGTDWDQLGGISADLSDYYTKSQVDDKLDTKANSIDVYTKDEVDDLIPTQLSQFTNDVGYIKDIPNAFTYSNLKGKPTIPSKTSQLTNDSDFITTTGSCSYATLSGSATTAINDKNGKDIADTYLPLSGGTLKGNLTGKYITGTWLQTTTTANLGSKPDRIAVINSDGYIFYRSPGDILYDIGAASRTDTYTKDEIDDKLYEKADADSIPTATSQLTNDTGFITSSGSCSYATSSGTALIATTATYDSYGNNIGNTYAKSDSVVNLSTNQEIDGTKTFNETIVGSITGNAETVTNGVYTSGDQTIYGVKTFNETIIGSISGSATLATTATYDSYGNNIGNTYAKDSSVVKLSGDQEIDGTKTFKKNIVGSISGNASTATNATNDSNGNNIISTYATKTNLDSKVDASTYESDIEDLETSIGTKADKSSLNNYLPLSGGTLTGNLTGQIITGTWLKSTADNHLSSTPSSYTVWNDGLLYNRTADELLKDISGMKIYPQAHYDCDTCYNVGLYLIAYGSNCPSGSPYGTLLVMPYRNSYSNSTPDYATQIFIPNGDDTSSPNSMFYRTSLSASWNSWKKVINNDTVYTGTDGSLNISNGSYTIKSLIKNATLGTASTKLYTNTMTATSIDLPTCTAINTFLRNGSLQIGSWAYTSFGTGKLPSAGLYLIKTSISSSSDAQNFIVYWDGSNKTEGTSSFDINYNTNISIFVNTDGTVSIYKGTGIANSSAGGFIYTKLISK